MSVVGAAAVGSLALLALVLSVTVELRKYASWRKRSKFVLGVVWIGWLCCFAIPLLVPIDVSASLYEMCIKRKAATATVQCERPLLYLSRLDLIPIWSAVYWSSFFACWLLYPLCQSYVLSRELRVRSRCWAAVKENLIFYLVAGVVSAAFLAWIAAQRHLDAGDVAGLAIGLANAWALLLLVALLGFGLVDVPRRLWRRANWPLRFAHRCFTLAQLHEEHDEAETELDTVRALVRRAKRARGGGAAVPSSLPSSPSSSSFSAPSSAGAGSTLQSDIDLLLSRIELELAAAEQPKSAATAANAGPSRRRKLTGTTLEETDSRADAELLCSLVGASRDSSDGARAARKALVKLRTRATAALAHERRAAALYKETVLQAIELQDIVEAGKQAASGAGGQFWPPAPVAWTVRRPRARPLLDQLEAVWLLRVSRPFWRLMAVLAACLSLMIIWSEVTLSLRAAQLDLSVFSALIHATKPRNDFLVQLLVGLPLVYTAVCAYSSLFRLRLFHYYNLVPHGQSDSNSLLFSAAYLLRLSAPLAYNYLNLIAKASPQVPSAFGSVMGNMSAVPALGEAFNFYFPVLVILLCLATLFNVYDRLLRCLHVKRFQFSEAHQDDALDVGQALLKVEIRKLVRANGSAPIDQLAADATVAAATTTSPSKRKRADRRHWKPSTQALRAGLFRASIMEGGRAAKAGDGQQNDDDDDDAADDDDDDDDDGVDDDKRRLIS